MRMLSKVTVPELSCSPSEICPPVASGAMEATKLSFFQSKVPYTSFWFCQKGPLASER